VEAIDQLVAVMARLRGPGGCPWDREQTHQSLVRYLIEEAYEAAEALERDDTQGAIEELGDVLLQVVFHAQIGREEGTYDLETIARTLTEKLIRRHPHVFGEATVENAREVETAWQAIKDRERQASEEAEASLMDGIPIHLPALARAEAIQRRAARVGFDWEDSAGPRAKVREELQELDQALAQGDREAARRELGDLLFAVVNLARKEGIDAEGALRSAVRRFERRFRRMEALAAGQGRSLEDMDLAEMDELWEEAKAEEAQG